MIFVVRKSSNQWEFDSEKQMHENDQFSGNELDLNCELTVESTKRITLVESPLLAGNPDTNLAFFVVESNRNKCELAQTSAES